MLNHRCANIYSATWGFAWQTCVLNVSEFVILTAAQTNKLSNVIDWQFIYDLHMCIYFCYFLFIYLKQGLVMASILALVLLVKWAWSFCGKVHTVPFNSKYIKSDE